MYASVHKDRIQGEPACKARLSFTAFDIVGVAASAGGIDALLHLLSALPESFPCPIVVVQHLCSAVRHRSALDRVLARKSPLQVKWAESGERLRAGYVLLAPQDSRVEIGADRTISVRQEEKLKGFRPAADPLFASIAAHFGARGAGVVLSGMLSDGAQGAYQIAAAGGRILVQDVQTAFAAEMPRAAIDTGAADFVFSPEMIAHALVTLTMVPGAAEWFRVGPKSLKFSLE